MYQNRIVRHLLDDVESYKRRGYNVDIVINIYVSGNDSFYFRLDDSFEIIDMDFLCVVEMENDVPLKSLIRCDDIVAYDFSIKNEDC